MIETLVSAALYAVKGGQLGRVPGFNKLRESNVVADAVLDGKVLSSIGFGILAGPLAGLAWLAGVSPKMGRIVGKIGGYLGNWDSNEKPYQYGVSRAMAIEGWKEGVQRGVFLGACITLATGNLAFIVAGAMFPVTVWLGVSAMQAIKKKVDVDWVFHEILFGAVIGFCL
jgi:hypothetical protein